MRHLLIILVLIAAFAVIGKSQGRDSKVAAEIIASSSTKVVKSSPFTAEAVSESSQTLPDGNRITRRSAIKMYRDGEGRFRREGMGQTGTEILSVYGLQNSISISDPVAAARFVLFPDSKTARRFKFQNPAAETIIGGRAAVLGKAEIEKSAVLKGELEKTAAQKANIVILPYPGLGTTGSEQEEQLGTKIIEGLEAKGVRKTMVIPAGSIGNERPIEIVYERWYSADLDLIVYSRHYDPRFGEQIYRLTNIDRSEPDRALFVVPSDYRIVDESALKLYTTKPE